MTVYLDPTYDQRKKWLSSEYGAFLGKTILDIRPMTKDEHSEFAWDYEREDGFVIIFTDGSVLIPSRDPEGNGAGFLFVAKVMVPK